MRISSTSVLLYFLSYTEAFFLDSLTTSSKLIRQYSSISKIQLESDECRITISLVTKESIQIMISYVLDNKLIPLENFVDLITTQVESTYAVPLCYDISTGVGTICFSTIPGIVAASIKEYLTSGVNGANLSPGNLKYFSGVSKGPTKFRASP